MTKKKTLEFLKNKAEESDRLKSAFLANMSHEIRTPLNAISGFAELLCQKAPDDSESISFKKIIMNSSSDLLHLINDILDYSKIEAGQLILNKESFSLNELFAELNLTYFKKNTNSLVKIDFLQTAEPIILTSDKQRIKQIIVNLADNALKFTEQGTIEVGYKTEKGNCILWVKDTGIGIPEDSRELIFERFQQVNKNPTRLYSGTGLGLTICKGLATLLGGKIWYEPNNMGGSIFSISIPYFSTTKNEHLPKNEPLVQTPDWKFKKILVVEDDPLSVKLITKFLTKTGVQIESFSDALSAIHFIQKNDVNLVLMDIRILGEMDGFETTKRIKQIKPHIPVIAQTAFAMDFDREKSVNSGCVDYISKPYSSEILIKTIARYI